MNKTKIDYATHTWNPLSGCLGPDGTGPCSYCFARRGYERFKQDFKPAFHPERLDQPRKRKKPARIFVCSVSDLFGPWVPMEQYEQVMGAMLEANWHTYLLLTKQPEEMVKRLPIPKAMPPNWHVGVSINNQQDADNRIPYLLKVPAAVRWLSVEPLLGPVELHKALSLPETCIHCGGIRVWDSWPKDGIKTNYLGKEGLDAVCLFCGTRGAFDGYKVQPPNVQWVAIGAQTGPGAIAPKTEWIESLVEQCKAAGVPIFLKGNLAPYWHWRENLIQEYPHAGH